MKHNLVSLLSRITITLACVVLCTSLSVHAAIWTNQSGGNWVVKENWSPNSLPEGGTTSGEASFVGDWATTGELVISTDLTPASTNTSVPRFRNILYNDSGAAPDAVLKITGTNALTFYNATAGSYPSIAPSGGSSSGGTVVRMDVEITSQNANTIQISCSDSFSRVYLDKKQTSLTGILLTRGALYLNAGNNTLPTNTLVTIEGTTAEWFALNGTTQEVAGLVTPGQDASRRIINDNAVSGSLIINVPAGVTNFCDARIGYGGNNWYAAQNTFGIVKKGAGVQIIDNPISSYYGTTLVQEGILGINNDGDSSGAIGFTSSLGTLDGDTTVSSGATLLIRGLAASFSEPLTISGAGFGGIGALHFSADGAGTAGLGITWKGAINLAAHSSIYVAGTNSQNVTCTGGFNDNGFGFTKEGSGLLILAPGSASGSSAVNSGQLGLGSGSSLNSLTMADSSSLSVTNSVTINSLSFGSGTAVLNIGYGDVAGVNPVGAAISNPALLNNATVTVNVSGSGFVKTDGTPIVLLDYSSKSGTGTFVKGTLPLGTVGTITDNGSQIVLNITAAVGDLVWSGTVNGNWDLSTKNWNSGTTNYQQAGGVGDIVKFYDGASTFNVNVATTVTPAAMTVNSGSDYTFSGSGKVSGVAEVLKQGYGALIVNNANDYSGGTRILNGTVRIGASGVPGQGTIFFNEVAVPQPTSLIVLSSDGTNPRTVTNHVLIAAANATPNVGTFGDAANNGALTFSGPVEFLPGITHNVTMASDVIFSGGVVQGGMNKYGAATWTLAGAPVNFTRGFDVRDGTLVFSGVNATNTGSLIVDAENAGFGYARMVITNGSVVHTYGSLRVGDDSAGIGNNYCDVAGKLVVTNGDIYLERAKSLYSEFNLLAGGDVRVRSVLRAGSATVPEHLTRFNFNGGTLRAAITTGSFMPNQLSGAYIQNGGATIDTDVYNIDIVQPLLADGTGGLTKLGSGQLALQGTNTFSGNIQVNGGTLMLYSAHQGTGGVSCADGAGFGMNSSGADQVVRLSSVTLGGATGGTLRARFGGGQPGSPTQPAGYVTNLTLNGTITVNVDFSVTGVPADHVVPLIGYGTLTGSPTFVRGPIGGATDADWVVINNSSAKQIQMVPVAMDWSSSGGSLSLSWPLLGAIVQSNSVSVADPGSWFDIPASASVTTWNITPDPARTNVFYRLRFPN